MSGTEDCQNRLDVERQALAALRPLAALER
jgi:hypothetical protein